MRPIHRDVVGIDLGICRISFDASGTDAGLPGAVVTEENTVAVPELLIYSSLCLVVLTVFSVLDSPLNPGCPVLMGAGNSDFA